MSGYEITCANKNTQGRIVRIGGSGWSLSIHEAIVKIVSNQLRFHMHLGSQFYEIGVSGEGTHAFLTLEPDGKPLHEVEQLPSC